MCCIVYCFTVLSHCVLSHCVLYRCVLSHYMLCAVSVCCPTMCCLTVSVLYRCVLSHCCIAVCCPTMCCVLSHCAVSMCAVSLCCIAMCWWQVREKNGERRCWDTLGQSVGGGAIGVYYCHGLGGNQVHNTHRLLPLLCPALQCALRRNTCPHGPIQFTAVHDGIIDLIALLRFTLAWLM